MADPATYINRWPDVSANLSLGTPALTLHSLEREIEAYLSATSISIEIEISGSVEVTTEASDHDPGRATSGTLGADWAETWARDQDWDRSLSGEFTQRFFRLREPGIFNRFPDLDFYDLDVDAWDEVTGSITSGTVSWDTRFLAGLSTDFSGRFGPLNAENELFLTWQGQSTRTGDESDACPGITNLVSAVNGNVVISPIVLLLPPQLVGTHLFSFSDDGDGTYGVGGEFSWEYSGSATVVVT